MSAPSSEVSPAMPRIAGAHIGSQSNRASPISAVLIGAVLLLISQHCFAGSAKPPRDAAAPQFDGLSPIALVASPDGASLFVACATASQVLRVEMPGGRILQRIRTPASPSGLALGTNGTRLYVTCAAPESAICVVDSASGETLATIRAGHTAIAPVLSRDEKILFVCDRFNDAVGVIDLAERKEVMRIPVQREPVAAVLTPDGKLLFVANHIHTGRSDVPVVAAAVSVIDVATLRVIRDIALPSGSTLLRGLCVSSDGRYVAVTHLLARFHLPTTQVERGWMNNNALSLIDVAQLQLFNTVLLDNLDNGAANPWAVAWSADAQSICVTHAGTHELSIIDAPALLTKLAKLAARPETGQSISASRTAADVPNDLAFLVGLRSRIKLPGNGPRALAMAGEQVFVAEYFSDSISTVSPARLSVRLPTVTPFQLTTNSAPSLVREGEMYFNDGTLAFQNWQSCASCHSSDARVDGMNWDLLNDGIGNPKNVKSLLLAFQTGRSMALGVRSNAMDAVRAGIEHSLFTVLDEHYPVAIAAYLRSLKPIPSPSLVNGKLTAAARRGEKLFFNDAIGCADCHKPPLFTDLKAHDAGTLGKNDRPTDRFYTPTLIELWRTAPYFHDGSAATLRDAVSQNPGDRRGHTSALTLAQIDDLVAYLKSL